MAARPRTSLRGLRTFCVAARHESFRLAADELFITASAVSHQIKGLEEELGVQLFVRSSRDLKLTETGRAFFDEVNPLIEQLDEQVSRSLFSRTGMIADLRAASVARACSRRSRVAWKASRRRVSSSQRNTS